MSNQPIVESDRALIRRLRECSVSKMHIAQLLSQRHPDLNPTYIRRYVECICCPSNLDLTNIPLEPPTTG